MRSGETAGGEGGRRQSVLGLGAGAESENGGELFGEPLSRRSTRGNAVEEGSEGGRRKSGPLNELWRGLSGRGRGEDVGGEQAR